MRDAAGIPPGIPPIRPFYSSTRSGRAEKWLPVPAAKAAALTTPAGAAARITPAYAAHRAITTNGTGAVAATEAAQRAPTKETTAAATTTGAVASTTTEASQRTTTKETTAVNATAKPAQRATAIKQPRSSRLGAAGAAGTGTVKRTLGGRRSVREQPPKQATAVQRQRRLR